LKSRQYGVNGDALNGKGGQRRAYQGHVARRPCETEGDAKVRGPESVRSTRSESFEGARADERALQRETQIAGL